MRSIWNSLVRVTLATLAVVFALAVLLGRLNHSVPDVREPALPSNQPISGHLIGSRDDDMHLLELASGRLLRTHIPGGDRLEHAAASPWRDRGGRTHIAGLWSGAYRKGIGPSTGVARYALPDWEVLDRVETEIVPAGPPCWFPDMSSRILFAAWDGQLYRLDFSDGPSGGASNGPRPLVWQVARPGESPMISNPIWPDETSLEGKLVATIMFEDRDEYDPATDTRRTRSELWWLQLSVDRTAIVGAGRLITGAADGAEHEERLPAVLRRAGRPLLLAYLNREQFHDRYRLRLAPLTIDAAGTPRIDATAAADVAWNGIFAAPAFSGDGRWVFEISPSNPSPDLAERIAVAELLAQAPVRDDALPNNDTATGE